ncbi:MAG: DUF4342 domain-containing protein [Oscillospiraceae bacterium]|nr:DUF4342 domain-containing protein [Oscillospiraceae bacterium]
MNETTEKILAKLKELVREGNIRRIKVTKDGEVLLNIPLTVGAGAGLLGLWAAPLLTVAGAVATIGVGCKIELENTEGEIIDADMTEL